MSPRRRIALSIVAMTALLAVAACAAAPQSRLGEFRTEAERLSADLISAIPSELEATAGMLNSRTTLGADISSHDDTASPAWWSVDQSVTFAPVGSAAKAAAAAMDAYFTAEGWSEKNVRVDDERTVDGYRKDGWYAEITWYATVAGKAEVLDLAIVSPETVRGDR